MYFCLRRSEFVGLSQMEDFRDLVIYCMLASCNTNAASPNIAIQYFLLYIVRYSVLSIDLVYVKIVHINNNNNIII